MQFLEIKKRNDNIQYFRQAQ